MVAVSEAKTTGTHLPSIRMRFETNLDFCASLLAARTNCNCSSSHACCLFTCDAEWRHFLSAKKV